MSNKSRIPWEIGVLQLSNILNNHFEDQRRVATIKQKFVQNFPPIYPAQSVDKSQINKKKAGRKHLDTGMIKRKDIVLKSVLRKIRSSIRSEFKNCFNYFNIIREVRLKQLEDILKDFIINRINEEPTKQMVEALGIFILIDDYELFLNNQKANPSKLVSK